MAQDPSEEKRMTEVVEYGDLNIGDVVHIVSVDGGVVTTNHGTITAFPGSASADVVELDKVWAFDVEDSVVVLVRPVAVEDLPHLFVRYLAGTLVRGSLTGPGYILERNWFADDDGKFRSVMTGATYDQSDIVVSKVLWEAS